MSDFNWVKAVGELKVGDEWYVKAPFGDFYVLHVKINDITEKTVCLFNMGYYEKSPFMQMRFSIKDVDFIERVSK